MNEWYFMNNYDELIDWTWYPGEKPFDYHIKKAIYNGNFKIVLMAICVNFKAILIYICMGKFNPSNIGIMHEYITDEFDLYAVLFASFGKFTNGHFLRAMLCVWIQFMSQITVVERNFTWIKSIASITNIFHIVNDLIFHTEQCKKLTWEYFKIDLPTPNKEISNIKQHFILTQLDSVTKEKSKIFESKDSQ